ncbi:hypothetical protein Tco_1433278, partial [Tanacetum coccineum]
MEKSSSDFHMPPALRNRNISGYDGVKNEVLTPRGEKKKRVHKI